jgi:hypothetical protein
MTLTLVGQTQNQYDTDSITGSVENNSSAYIPKTVRYIDEIRGPLQLVYLI